MALVPFPKQEVSASLHSWIAQCPDFEELKSKMDEYTWLMTKKKCPECATKNLRKDQVYDNNGPYSDGEQLICLQCWNNNNTVTKENELPWTEENESPIFAKYSKRSKQEGSDDGKEITHILSIYHTKRKKVIGQVTNYNPKFHTGKVTLNGMEAFVEFGELDTDCEVRSNVSKDNIGSLVGPLGQNKKARTDLYCEDEVVYCARLEDQI